MSDSLRTLFGGGSPYRRLTGRSDTSEILQPHDPYTFSARIIARNELRVWFEPDWYVARRLAARFPRCLVCSIPVENDTPAFRRVPGWRPARDSGARL